MPKIEKRKEDNLVPHQTAVLEWDMALRNIGRRFVGILEQDV